MVVSLPRSVTLEQAVPSGKSFPNLLQLKSNAYVKSRNFECHRVKSINASGHKFGLVYAGVGWIIWRDESYLPKHLIFELHYLGGTEESYTLNFSRPGAQVIAQYYNLIHLGFSGYKDVMENSLANARLLSKALEATGWYTCVSDIHRKKGKHSFEGVQEPVFGEENETSADYNAGLPVVAFRFSDDFQQQFPHVQQESLSTLLRVRQYIVPSKPTHRLAGRLVLSLAKALDAVPLFCPIIEKFIHVVANAVSLSFAALSLLR